MLLYVENSMKPIKKLLQIVNKFSKGTGYKIYKNQVYFCALSMNHPKIKL